ncbi:uncharacterized protein I303_104732 [Kwoniella dejecticola CBS 10117]|uniref:Homeobox domain-containing protein n=1 Tax=Kwoniella dejecticola CBS 10117 TaxID=1296121 RepID=A0A1A6A4H5_9TREE|nr:uncharacterized protein I303_04288 [Kwoniella dejecticola CBS 10117]OBR84962.1 hypothetical protein I303_04288 [Kwoniella dejecticola CBS 10117]
MSPTLPPLSSPDEVTDKENMPITLPPIRDIHATPKNNSHLPPTPSTIPPLHSRQDQNLITPIQSRVRQPLQSFPQTNQPNIMMTPQSNGMPIQPYGVPSSALAFDEKRYQQPTPQTQPRPHQTPCPRPSVGLPITSAARTKVHPPNGTPLDTNAFNVGYPNAPLRTPHSILTTRTGTMGRSVSTPTLPFNAVPYALSNKSAASTRYSPSVESNQSSSVSRSAVKGRAQMSFSPSPTPSSPTPIDLSGIQPPAPFPGAYPIAYTRKDPVPADEGEPESENKRSGRQGAPSWNPWDYVLGEVPGGEQAPNQTPGKDEDAKGNKIRRRFTKRELEALEVLWSISKSPSKYERQRLGAWLGVKTKHITVWFQNRRQEEKRYLREGAPVEPPPPSRSNRGTFDPVTGKWRPVPLSCISGLQPPPEEKSAVVRSISVGDLTRDMYFSQHPELDAHLPTPTPSASNRMYTTQGNITPLPKRGNGNSLDQILQAREISFDHNRKRPQHQQPQRRGSVEGKSASQGVGQGKFRELLALLPSDPPSMDLSEIAGDDDSEAGDGSIDSESPKRTPLGARGGAMGLDRMLNGPSGATLGRATSLDLLASAPRKGKYWSSKSVNNGNALQPKSINGSPSGVLGAINPNVPLDRAKPGMKHTLPPLSGSASKRARMDGTRPRPATSFKPKDSFSRSQSAAVLETPSANKENVDRGEMKTPGFARSFSFSSSASDGVAITPDNAVLAKKQTDGTKKEEKEVRDAAEIMLQLLGGSQ